MTVKGFFAFLLVSILPLAGLPHAVAMEQGGTLVLAQASSQPAGNGDADGTTTRHPKETEEE